MMPASARLALDSTARNPHIVYCDGGLCNRLNALIYSLVLRGQFGGEWSLSWPRNNWCGAAFAALFSIDMPVISDSLSSFSRLQDDYLFLVHELQGDLRPPHVVLNRSLLTLDAYGALLRAGRPVFYYHNLIPHAVDIALLERALGTLKVAASIERRARDFCLANQIDSNVTGLHIRKTDFGPGIDEGQLFDTVAAHPGRFFLCSDDRAVNERFGTLANCCVLEKTNFPQKLHSADDWNCAITDTEGRSFPYNITRPEASVVEALVDLLILSVTTPASTSASTFLGMARLFHAARFFRP